MISSNLISLLANKYVLGSLSVLIALLVAYFKGSSAAKRSAELDRFEAERAEQSRLRAAEAKNLFLEKQGEKKNEEINSADAIDTLIGMWDSLQPKGKRGPSDKNPK